MTDSVRSAAQFESAVPQFTVGDVVATAKHYRDVLGFEIEGFWDGERAHQDPGARALFGIVRRGAVRVFFNLADGGSVRSGRAEGAYDVYINVTGLEALARELRENGADILDGPADREYGQRELVIRDCNGLVLAFGEAVAGAA